MDIIDIARAAGADDRTIEYIQEELELEAALRWYKTPHLYIKKFWKDLVLYDNDESVHLAKDEYRQVFIDGGF